MLFVRLKLRCSLRLSLSVYLAVSVNRKSQKRRKKQSTGEKKKKAEHRSLKERERAVCLSNSPHISLVTQLALSFFSGVRGECAQFATSRVAGPGVPTRWRMDGGGRVVGGCTSPLEGRRTRSEM